MAQGEGRVAACCAALAALALALGVALVAAYAFVVPVRVTVDDASLGGLALAGPSPANGTASIAYNVSLAVSLHNHNWAMSVWLTAPLVAELRFRGHTFLRSESSGDDWERIHALSKAVYGMEAAEESAPMALGRGGAAEFARERAAGVFDLELAVFAEVKYEARRRRRAIRVTCPLRLSPSAEPAPPGAFARVVCT